MKAQYRNTGVMPKTLAAEPHLGPALLPYGRAYLELTRRRQLGYASTQPLSAADILMYGHSCGFSDDIEFFFRIISALDDEHVKKEMEKMDKASKNGRGKSAKPSKPPRRGRRR
jgi:hypothetical protein